MAFRSGGNGGGGPLPPRENVAFKVTSYDVKDRYKPSVDDTFNAVLLTEAFGQPIGTEMTFRQARIGEKGLTIHSMLYGSSKPRLEPTMIEGQGIAEGSYLDRKSNQVVMNWLTVKVRKPEDVDQLLVGQYFSVDSERKSDGGYVSQNRYMYDTQHAIPIADVSGETMLAAIGNYLATPASNLGGEPGFMLRGIDLDRYEDEAFSSTRMTLGRVDTGNGVYRDATPKEAIDRFLENQYYKRFRDDLLDPADPVKNPLIELIPIVRIRTGQDSLPSQGAKDDSNWFKLALNPEEPDPTKHRFAHYIGRGHTHIRWQHPKEEGRDGSFFSTKTLPITRQNPLFAPAEILTPNLPPEVADFFMARAEAVGLRADPPRSSEPRPSTTAPSETASGPRP